MIQDRKALQWAIFTAQNITGTQLRCISHIDEVRCLNGAQRILKDKPELATVCAPPVVSDSFLLLQDFSTHPQHSILKNISRVALRDYNLHFFLQPCVLK